MNTRLDPDLCHVILPRMRRRSFALLLSICPCIWACSQEVVAVVSVNEIPAGTTSLRAYANVGGSLAREPAVFSLAGSSSHKIGLRFDYPLADLPMRVTVGAFDPADCLLALGETASERIPRSGGRVTPVDLATTLKRPLNRPPCGSTQAILFGIEPDSMYAPRSLRPSGSKLTLSGWGFFNELSLRIAGRTQELTLDSFVTATVHDPDLPLLPGPLSVELRAGAASVYASRELLEVKLAPPHCTWLDPASPTSPIEDWVDLLPVDLDQDGAPDVLGLDGKGGLWLFRAQARQGGALALPAPVQLATLPPSIAFAAGNDARLVMARLSGQPDEALLVITTAGSAAFTRELTTREKPALLPLWDDPSLRGDAAVVMDIDHREPDELVLLRAGKSVVALAQKNGRFDPMQIVRQRTGNFREVAAVDLDGDARRELLLVAPSDPRAIPLADDLFIWQGGWNTEKPDRSFRLFSCLPLPTRPTLLFPDLNQDGAPDIMASGTFAFLYNRPDLPEGFSPGYSDPNGCTLDVPMAVVDVNGDSVSDLVWLFDAHVRVLLGQPGGRFASVLAGKERQSAVRHASFPQDKHGFARPGPRRLPVVDLNRDGSADLLFGTRAWQLRPHADTLDTPPGNDCTAEP